MLNWHDLPIYKNIKLQRLIYTNILKFLYTNTLDGLFNKKRKNKIRVCGFVKEKIKPQQEKQKKKKQRPWSF